MPAEDIERFLWEDVGSDDDSSELVPRRTVRAGVLAKQDGVLAGLEEACAIFRRIDVACIPRASDGNPVEKGGWVLDVEGDSWAVLKGERVALNLMSRMSGIATLTRRCVEALEAAGYGRVRVAATRKTTPGFRRYEKKAVKLGGGDTHRYDLSSAIMLKDNHQGIGDLASMVAMAKRRSFTKKVEVEAHSPESALVAARAGADIVMLDNFSPAQVARTVPRIREVDARVVIEASGGINLQNIVRYAEGGVDVVSLGALTHSAPALDFSLELREIL